MKSTTQRNQTEESSRSCTTQAIKRVAVLGAGTMGGAIAALLASVGLDVVLLDRVPSELTESEKKARLSLKDRVVRNRWAQGGLDSQKNIKPPAFYHVDAVKRIRVGNFEDDLGQLSEADWVIEVIIEDLPTKQALYRKVEVVVASHAIVSSNTSGLLIGQLVNKCSKAFQKRFMGTHFFNPPRYLPLLEIIPTIHTDPVCVEQIIEFATHRLGKQVVLAKDTPNFIANRLGGAISGFRVSYAIDHNYSVEAADAIGGPLMGYPKTAVFRLVDLVGLDIIAAVGEHLSEAFPDEVASYQGSGRAEALTREMIGQEWLGNKSGIGFYKRVQDASGQTQFQVLDLKTMQHRPPEKVRYDSMQAVKRFRDLGERLRQWIQYEDDAALYVWNSLAFMFSYTAQHVWEVADDLISVDRALCGGFAIQMGPFACWDALGVAATVTRMERDGYEVAAWVKEMLAIGITKFYRIHRHRSQQYDPKKQAYTDVVGGEGLLQLPLLRQIQTPILSNPDAYLYDAGDGVLLFEFQSKSNLLTEALVTLLIESVEYLNNDGHFKAMVIGNEGGWFSAGANINPQTFASSKQSPKERVAAIVAQFQSCIQAIRFSHKPVVCAAFDRTLGGGAEVVLAAHRIIAHAELYMGLVEMGVGLIPAGGGCKELLRRWVNPVMRDDPAASPLPALQRLMQIIGMAEVSMGAWQARDMKFLSPCDRIIMNKSSLLQAAKQEALTLSQQGFLATKPEKIYAAGAEAYGALCLGLSHLRESGYLSAYDLHLGKRLAWVLCGGDLTSGQWVDESFILSLEAQVFSELITQPKTIERIMTTLKTGKPLRN